METVVAKAEIARASGIRIASGCFGDAMGNKKKKKNSRRYGALGMERQLLAATSKTSMYSLTGEC